MPSPNLIPSLRPQCNMILVSERPLLFTIKYFSSFSCQIPCHSLFHTDRLCNRDFSKLFTPKIFRIWNTDLNTVCNPRSPRLPANLPWVQVKRWFYVLLLKSINGMSIYMKHSGESPPGQVEVIGESRKVGLNFGWILKSPWKLKNNTVPRPHPRIIRSPRVGPRHPYFLNYPGWVHVQPTLRSTDLGGVKCT